MIKKKFSNDMALMNVKKIKYFEKTANMQRGFIKNKSVYCRLAIAHRNFLFFVFIFKKTIKDSKSKSKGYIHPYAEKKSTLKKPADLTNKLIMLLHKTNEHFGDHDTEFEEATLCSTKIIEGSPVLLWNPVCLAYDFRYEKT